MEQRHTQGRRQFFELSATCMCDMVLLRLWEKAEPAMAEDVDIRFLGEQIKRVQSDVRVLQTDLAQSRADQSRLNGEVAGVKADIIRVENRLDAFAESVTDRFDQATELAKSNFRILNQKIDRVAGDLDQKIDKMASDLDQKIDRVDQKIDRVDQRIDRVEAKIDQVMVRIDALNR
jgi:chromosome segregation ATPase